MDNKSDLYYLGMALGAFILWALAETIVTTLV